MNAHSAPTHYAANHLSEQDLRTLAWNQIPAPKPGSRKTLCPVCAKTRTKKNRPSLGVFPRDWGVHVFCHHCEWAADLPH